MRPHFIAAVYFEGDILLFTEWGEVYRFTPRTQTWMLLSAGPFPEKEPQ
jgi:hypothetical protein